MRVYERPLRSDELMHFGVLGMKWGVRRYQNYDGTWKNAGKKRHIKQQESSENGETKQQVTTTSAHSTSNTSLKTNTSQSKTTEEVTNDTALKKKGLTDNQKKAIKIGAAVVGTAVVAYGAYKLGERIKVSKAAETQLLREAVLGNKSSAKTMAKSAIDGSVDSDKYKKYLHEFTMDTINNDNFKRNKDRLVKKQLKVNWNNREKKVIDKAKNITNPYSKMFNSNNKYPNAIKDGPKVTRKDIAKIPSMSADELKSRGWNFSETKSPTKPALNIVKETASSVKTSSAKSGIDWVNGKLDPDAPDLFERPIKKAVSSGSDYTQRILNAQKTTNKKVSSIKVDDGIENYTKDLLKKMSKI